MIEGLLQRLFKNTLTYHGRTHRSAPTADFAAPTENVTTQNHKAKLKQEKSTHHQPQNPLPRRGGSDS